MAKKSPLKSTRLVQRRRRRRILRLSILLFVIIVGVVGMSWLTHLDGLHISTIEIRGNIAVDSRELELIAHDAMQGNYGFVLSKSNRFLYPGNFITNQIEEKYERVQSVDLHIENSHTLVVDIVERQPAYVWCTGTPSERQGRECYFTDASGYIFSEAPVFSGNAYFFLYGLVDPAHIVGSTYLPQDAFSRIKEFIAFSNKQNLGVYALYGKGENSYEVHLTRGGKILFNDDGDTSLLEENLNALIQNTTLFSPKSKTLNYVDLRFGNKVYYTFVGDNSVQTVQ